MVTGVSWGREIFRYNGSVSELWVMLRLLLLWTFLMWLSLAYSVSFFLPPSRRLANYTFFTWIIGRIRVVERSKYQDFNLLSAYNLTILTAFLLTDLVVIHLNNKSGKAKPSQIKTISAGYRCPQLVFAVDYNPLFLFLLANIATGILKNIFSRYHMCHLGLVNMMVPTIHTGGLKAVLILVLYEASLGLIITVFYRYKIRLKFY